MKIHGQAVLGTILCGMVLCASCTEIDYHFVDDDDDGHSLLTDCADDDPTINPDSMEVCGDAIDSDCDGEPEGGNVAEGVQLYPDLDGDGFGRATGGRMFCGQVQGWATDPGDCDDNSAERSPDTLEVCVDRIDNDCDELIDDADPTAEPPRGPWFVDADRDGYGTSVRFIGCAGFGFAAQSGDCDEGSGGVSVNPGIPEVCNGIDDDCDDLVDDADPDIGNSSLFYLDADGDGYGDPNASVAACAPPSGSYVTIANDCDDGDMAVNPQATEVCGNATDDDCDGQADGVRFVPRSFFEPDVDVTSEFSSGSPFSPYVYTPQTRGELKICSGTYYVQLRPEDDLTVVGLGEADDVILNGAGGTVAIPPRFGSISLSSLTIANGGASQFVRRPGSTFATLYSAGGGIFCSRTSTSFSDDVVLDNVIVENNSAELGGGLFAERCRVSITNSLFRNNSASFDGGGAYIAQGSAFATMRTTSFTSNSAFGTGGGLFIFSDGGSWTGTVFTGNVAQRGAAIGGSQSFVTFSGGSIGGNTATLSSGGQVYLRDSAFGVRFTSVTFGTDIPSIVTLTPSSSFHTYMGSTSVACLYTSGGCF